MRPVIRKIDLPKGRRILAVSDIHGHRNHLKNLLEKVGFTNEDILFIVGDIIEKGPESLETLRYVRALCRQYDSVYPLMGNVDAWRILMLDAQDPASDEQMLDYLRSMKRFYGGCFFAELCAEAGLPAETPEQIRIAKARIPGIFRTEIDFLRNLPTIIDTQNYLFVHAGLPAADLSRLETYDAFEFLKRDAFLEQGLSFGKYVIVGHWPVMLYGKAYPQADPIIDRQRKIISIDGGCGIKEDGQLNMLILPAEGTGEITYESYDDLPQGIAVTAQQEAPATVFVKWTDCAVEVLEEKLQFSRVRHITSGKIFAIPNDYLLKYEGKTLCGDYTDYKIEVNPGDRLSMDRENPQGYFVKKNGRSGWYCGDIIPISP